MLRGISEKGIFDGQIDVLLHRATAMCPQDGLLKKFCGVLEIEFEFNAGAIGFDGF